MARPDRDRDRSKRGPKDLNRRGGKKRVCIFCKDNIDWVDYKDSNLLRRFMSDRGKIRARRVTGNCAQHQREVAVAIKTARELALLPYTQRTVSERGPGRGPRCGPGDRGAPRGPRRDEDTAETEEVDDLEVDLAVEDEDEEAAEAADAVEAELS